jgi:hypothetical protein
MEEGCQVVVAILSPAHDPEEQVDLHWRIGTQPPFTPQNLYSPSKAKTMSMERAAHQSSCLGW